MSASSWTSRHASRLGALLVAGAASGLLLSCSGGGVATPAQDVVGDTYLIARITVLDDVRSPCTALTCDPEFYQCRTRAPIANGTVYTLHADQATAGILGGSVATDPGPPPTVTHSDDQLYVTGTDTTTGIGLSLRLQVDTIPAVAGSFSGAADDTYVDLDILCDRVQLTGPESRFVRVNAGTVNVTTSTTDGLRMIPAVSDGAGGFNPAGILEGTFSFVAEGIQTTPLRTLTPDVLVEGCFRLNLPAPDRGVPVRPSPSSAPCN